MWKRWLRTILARMYNSLRATPPQPDIQRIVQENLELRRAQRMSVRREAYMERLEELAEARQMAGAGPWLTSKATLAETDKILTEAVRHLREGSIPLREDQLPANNGWWGELDLLLDTAEWRREINLSWLEFSRWGIQQIILISRLYWMKNAIIRRAVNIAAVYVFGRSVDISSPDEKAQAVIDDFIDRNPMVLGHGALVDQERQKYLDGNLFWVFFADKVDKGKVSVRTIDATEIQEIITNPEDTDEPWFYRRDWTFTVLDMISGNVKTDRGQQWYPALGYDPDDKPPTMRGFPINWDKPVLHRKCGKISKWRFGCPIIYPALDWAKTAKKWLEACYTTAQSHAQLAWEMTTKGGQAAIAGMKSQLETSVNAAPGNSIYDTNPTAVNASVFASGPGTTMKPIQTRGAGGDPSEVKEYRNMVGIVVGIPPTWLGDLETANLSTATTLDRPTELGFEEKQQEWREDLTTMFKFVLRVSAGAASGTLREAYKSADLKVESGAMRRKPSGRLFQEAKKRQNGTVELSVNFPAIREGDMPALIKATVEAMTLDNKGGEIIGIDEKVGVKQLYTLLDIEGGDEIAETQYPEGEYEPDRTKEVMPPPIQRAQPVGGIQPQPAAVPGVIATQPGGAQASE